MGLDVPDLDDRGYEELLADARKRVPVHAEEWTDHNAHDPGVTVLELLAWLAESHAYQLDQVTDAHRRKYLELVGAEPRPPRRATVTLSLSMPASADGAGAGGAGGAAGASDLDGTEVAAGTELVAETPDGRRERFRTTESAALSATGVAAVLSERGGDRTDHSRANESAGLHFRAFGDDPSAGDALYLGFDGDPFASPTLDLWVDFHEADLPAPATHGDEEPAFEPSLRCVWEHCTRPAAWYRDDAWAAVEPTRDETNALYRGGRVRLVRPDGWLAEPARLAGHDADLHWLRCRLAAREGPDAPAPRYEVPPQLNAVEANVVRATHETAVESERLRTPDGDRATTAAPNQRFAFDAAPVQSATVRVGGERWATVEDFDASTPDDTAVVLDRAAGTVTFGDGRRGAIPEPGRPVEADYVAGGGPAGNLPESAEWRFDATALERVGVDPLAPPAGGREAESVDAALARARERRRTPFRAVTADDHAAVATRTPGLRFGRAAVADASGPVTVAVVPYSPDGRRPVPSAGFREAVERHLREHALLTERVSVVGPTYVPVAVRATVETVPGADPEAVRRRARTAVESFLDPLDGFEGDGWPFGRPVYRSELYERLEGVEGVADADGVTVSARGDVDLRDRGDTLPAVVAVDVDLRDRGDRCVRGSR